MKRVKARRAMNRIAGGIMAEIGIARLLRKPWAFPLALALAEEPCDPESLNEEGEGQESDEQNRRGNYGRDRDRKAPPQAVGVSARPRPRGGALRSREPE